MRHGAGPWNRDSDKVGGDEESDPSVEPKRDVGLDESDAAPGWYDGSAASTLRSQLVSARPAEAPVHRPGAHRRCGWRGRRGWRAWRPAGRLGRCWRRRGVRGALVLLAGAPVVVWLGMAVHRPYPSSTERLPPAPVAPVVSAPEPRTPAGQAVASASAGSGEKASSGQPLVSAGAVAAPSGDARSGELPRSPQSAQSAQSAQSNPAPAGAPPRQPVRYLAVRGPGCPGGGYVEHGAYSAGLAGWYRKDAGGWVGDGCSGAMTAVPMSGVADRDDPTAWVSWSFDVGPVGVGTCAVAVYVPRTDDWRDAAGHPAFYDVAAGSSGTRIGTFTVDQLAAQGTWATAGSFNVNAGAVVITMHTRGVDWNMSGPTYAHLAAAQIRVSCTATA